MTTKTEQVEELKVEIQQLKKQIYAMREGHYTLDGMNERVNLYCVEVTDWSGSSGKVCGKIFTTNVMVAKVVQMALTNVFSQFRVTVSRKKDVYNDNENTHTTI